MNTTSNMVHVPTNSLVVSHKEMITRKANVRIFQTGKILLNGFAIAQFLEGFELYVKDDTRVNIPKEMIVLSLKITKGIGSALQLKNAEFEFDYEELKTLRTWLEIRMRHCEIERDNRTVWSHNPEVLKFNPDTYIGQKLLLLDLRELLLGEIIPEVKSTGLELEPRSCKKTQDY